MILLHAKYNATTHAVSSIVATNDPSTLLLEPCKGVSPEIYYREKKKDTKPRTRQAEETYAADYPAEEEIIELAEDEQDCGYDVVPHRSDLVEHPDDDVEH